MEFSSMAPMTFVQSSKAAVLLLLSFVSVVVQVIGWQFTPCGAMKFWTLFVTVVAADAVNTAAKK
jgi:hypothetical protein